MKMAQALILADMMKANTKEWDAARIEAFDQYKEKDEELAEFAYEIFTKKVEKKEQRRRKARKRVEDAKAKQSEGNDSAQNQQHQQGGFHES